MKRKGLSQILYLIIAASVLMMIAMVITFTATDIIGGAGGQASNRACQDAIVGKCAAAGLGGSVTTLPTSCIDDQNNEFLTTRQVYNDQDSTGTAVSPVSGPNGGSQPFYVECN